MGLPAGHVTDTPGLTRNHALKALGNGVVPQQCAAALRAYLADEYGVQIAAPSLVPTGSGSLLPTPACNDMGEGKTVEAWDEWTAKMQAAHGNGNGHGKSLAIEAQRIGVER